MGNEKHPGEKTNDTRDQLLDDFIGESPQNTQKSAVVSIIGRPSAGKSTFLNTVCGAKVSIVSSVPQTTRNAIRGIVNRPEGQLLFIDTPGYHDSEKKLNLFLRTIAQERLPESDCILYIIDASREPAQEEKLICSLLIPFASKIVVGINKIDLELADLQGTKQFLKENLPDVPMNRIFEISAEKNIHLENLLKALFDISPTGHALYPEEFYTDQEVDFRIAEIIREKAIIHTREELPHSIYVEIADLEQRKNGKLLWVRAFVVVERESQKSMVIGKGASMIKKIRLEALSELNKIFPYKITLDLQVKVNKNWRQKDPIIKRLVNR